MSLDKSKILAADDAKLKKVAVPEWGGDVYLRVISGTAREAFEESYADQKLKSFRVRFLLLTLCNETGERLFADNEVDVLGGKSSVVISRLFEAAWELNAFTKEAVEDLGANFHEGQSESSSSVSP